MRSGTTAEEADWALQEVKRDARLLFIKIYCFRPSDNDLKAILEAQNRNSDLRRRQTWKQLHALLLLQQQALRRERSASQARWQDHSQQWAQWLAEFQQVLQAQAAARERHWDKARQQQSYKRARSRTVAPARQLQLPPQPWQVLGLDPNAASVPEIKRAYRRLALEHHPDRGGCVERFLEIRQAYELLIAAAR